MLPRCRGMWGSFVPLSPLSFAIASVLLGEEALPNSYLNCCKYWGHGCALEAWVEVWVWASISAWTWMWVRVLMWVCVGVGVSTCVWDVVFGC